MQQLQQSCDEYRPVASWASALYQLTAALPALSSAYQVRGLLYQMLFHTRQYSHISAIFHALHSPTQDGFRHAACCAFPYCSCTSKCHTFVIVLPYKACTCSDSLAMPFSIGIITYYIVCSTG